MNKRPTTDLNAPSTSIGAHGVGLSRNKPDLPDEVQARLLHVGQRVRKHVSDGHATSSAARSLSYTGDTVGPLDRESIEAQFRMEAQLATKSKTAIGLRREQWTAPRSLKRSYDEEEDGDTDVDDDLPDKPGSMSSIRAYYAPHGFVARSQASDNMGDFEEAPYLQPRDAAG